LNLYWNGSVRTSKLDPVIFEDHRGTIQSWPVDNNIVEYNLMITRQGDQRGYHYHPHFDEYMLVVEGVCCFTEYTEQGPVDIEMTVGDSIHIPSNTAHTFTALTDFKFVSMLTKQWEKSDPPIVKVDTHGNTI